MPARPPAIGRFISSARDWLPAARAERIDRSTERLFADAIVVNPDGTAFVLTGDIPAMWIRDSTWQVLPLLLMDPDAELLAVLAGVSRMQARFLAIDPYANAFNNGPTGQCWHRDFVDQSPWVFERKFELDSIAAFFELATALHDRAGCAAHLDADFWATTGVLLELLHREQHHDRGSYRFVRSNAPVADFLGHGGVGAPFEPNGMVWSAFRPSDDRCELPFHVPANAHLAVVLQRLALLAEAAGHPSLAARAAQISRTVSAALVDVEEQCGRWPYEVDGLGNAVFSDDPNVPSLLALPYLGWRSAADPTYQATRQYLLSPSNPGWRSSALAEGLASEHTPVTHIWPLSIAVRGLTATSRDEQLACLRMLEATDGGTGCMHESFDMHDPSTYTRAWFSWADMTYVELALRAR